MGRFTLRLPESLHQQLEVLARNEGVSLNQYIVYNLTRQAANAYRVYPVPQADVARQEEDYARLLESLGQATYGEIEVVLAEREPVEPEPGLTPEIVYRVREKMTAYSARKKDN